MKKNLNEIILSHNEFVYLLRLLDCMGIAGMTLEELKDTPANKIFEAGTKDKLMEKSFIKIKKGNVVIQPRILKLIYPVAKRDMAFVLIRGIKGIGEQLFVFNCFKNEIIEHTLPDENTHRLALISSFQRLIERFNELVPLNAVKQDGRPECIVDQPGFEAFINGVIKSQLKEYEIENKLSGFGFDKNYNHHFLQALKFPELTISIACLYIVKDQIEYATSVSIFADMESSWGIWPHKMDESPPLLMVFPTGIADVFSVVSDWYHARSEPED